MHRIGIIGHKERNFFLENSFLALMKGSKTSHYIILDNINFLHYLASIGSHLYYKLIGTRNILMYCDTNRVIFSLNEIEFTEKFSIVKTQNYKEDYPKIEKYKKMILKNFGMSFIIYPYIEFHNIAEYEIKYITETSGAVNQRRLIHEDVKDNVIEVKKQLKNIRFFYWGFMYSIPIQKL